MTATIEVIRLLLPLERPYSYSTLAPSLFVQKIRYIMYIVEHQEKYHLQGEALSL